MKVKLYLLISFYFLISQSLIAVPQNWNKDQSYLSGDLVINEGKSYVSKKNVPAGISLYSGTYWAALDAMVPDSNTPSIPPNTPTDSIDSTQSYLGTVSQSIVDLDGDGKLDILTKDNDNFFVGIKIKLHTPTFTGPYIILLNLVHFLIKKFFSPLQFQFQFNLKEQKVKVLE